MNYLANQFDAFNYADSFSKYRMLSRRASQETMEILTNLVDKGGSNKLILDACAGTGRFTKLIIKSLPNACVHAIDRSPVMLQKIHCDNQLRKLELIMETSFEDFSNGVLKYDIVCASSAIHLFELSTFFNAAVKVLKPFGLIVVRTSTIEDLQLCNPLGSFGKAHSLDQSRAHSRVDILTASTFAHTKLVQECQITSVRYYTSNEYIALLKNRAKSVLFSLTDNEIETHLKSPELQGFKRHKLSSTNTFFVFRKTE